MVECRIPDERPGDPSTRRRHQGAETTEEDVPRKRWRSPTMIQEELAVAKKSCRRLKEKKKFEDLEKENNKWEILATEEKIRLKKDARQQCLELVDDTLPPGVNLTQDEDGWGGAWIYDLQEADFSGVLYLRMKIRRLTRRGTMYRWRLRSTTSSRINRPDKRG